MVPFAGWEMPVQYTGVIEEAKSVRTAAGAFDISHMGRLRLRGPLAFDVLQRCTTNDVGALTDGRAQYSLLPTPDGGIVDDIIVYRISQDDYMVVVNASNTERDIGVLNDAAGGQTPLQDESAQTCMVAVQGPRAVELVQKGAPADLAAIPRFGVGTTELFGRAATLCRTGYTGEDGFEIIVAAEDGPEVWDGLMELGVVPCGLGARDSLRIEAGYPLYGHEIDETTSPVEAGLMWAVRLDKGPFTGREAIARTKAEGGTRRLIGLVMDDRAIPRQGYTVVDGGTEIGQVTSGAFAATRGLALGMAYLRRDAAKAGRRVGVVIRGAQHMCTLVPKKELISWERGAQ
jgi:aminomethyltransferase